MYNERRFKMLATAKGYYNGSQIVLDTPVQFQRGQEVIVTYTVIHSTPHKNSQNALVDFLIGAIPPALLVPLTCAGYKGR